MSKSVKWLIAALVAITAASVVAMVFMIARRPDTDDEDEVVKEKPQTKPNGGYVCATRYTEPCEAKFV